MACPCGLRCCVENRNPQHRKCRRSYLLSGWSRLDHDRHRKHFIPRSGSSFRRAHHVLSVLGSGLTGMIYSPDGADVVTLAPSNWSDRFFFAIMQNRDARLVDIRGRSRATDTAGAAGAPFHRDRCSRSRIAGVESFQAVGRRGTGSGFRSFLGGPTDEYARFAARTGEPAAKRWQSGPGREADPHRDRSRAR